MKLASIYDRLGSNGQPEISTDRVRLDPALAKKVVKYLRSATQVSKTADVKIDLLDPNQKVRFASSVSTDGQWYWREELTVYVERHLLSPGEDFVRHIQDSGFVPPRPDKAQYDAVLVKIGAAPAHD